MLKGKNVIITGSRRGIGRATVEKFAKNGANIWACARKYDPDFEAAMQKLSAENNVEIWPLYFDVTDDDQVKQAVKEIREKKINVDALINIAGIAEESASFQMTSIEKMRKVLEVNYIAPTVLTQYISRIMIRQRFGSIVNLASVAGLDGEPSQYEYAASKAALIGGTKELARELAQYNIRVNAIAPGMINTDMGKQIQEELKQQILSKTILGRMGEPEEVANVIAFVTSDLASYITGQVISVNGGFVI